MLEIKNVVKCFKKNVVLDHVNLQFEKGKIYGICGENGCGKTVLLKIICGLMNANEGEILYEGKNIAEVKPSFGILFNGDGFFTDLNAFENLNLLASIRHKISQETIRKMIENVGLDPFDKRPVRKYSLGMLQRLSIAQALMEDDEIILLDEPTNALDESGVQRIHKLIKLEQEKNKIILLTSHNRFDIDSLCNNTYRIKDGKVLKNE